MEFEGRFGRRALRRLRREQVLWLTSVDEGGQPQPRPVWFHWDGKNVLIYSQPRTGKVRQIARNSRVAVHFNSTEDGDDVVVFGGRARVETAPIPEDRRRVYLRKYREGIRNLDMTPQSFAGEYRVPILVDLETLRGF